MDEVKVNLKNLRDIYENSTDLVTRKALRVQIFELEKHLRNLCVEHGGPLVFDEYGDWDYSELDKNGNCKICGLSITYMKSSK